MKSTMPSPRPGAKVSAFRSHANLTGSARYGVTYVSIDGRRERFTIGSRKEAELAAGPLRLQSFEGMLGKEPTPRISIERLRELHIDRIAGKKDRKRDESRWKAIVLFFEDRKIQDITAIKPSTITDFRAWLMAPPWAREPATVNRHLAILRAALNIAIEEKAITENPVRGGKRGHFFEERPRERTASREEMARLLESADPELRLAIILAHETALRESPIVEMERSRVNIEQREMYVPETKNGDSITVPLSTRAVDALRDRMKTHSGERLFTVLPATICRRWKELCNRIGIKDLRFHDLRATAATRMIRAGVDQKAVMRIGGWRTIQSLTRYVRLNTSDLHSAIARVEDSERAAETRGAK